MGEKLKKILRISYFVICATLIFILLLPGKTNDELISPVPRITGEFNPTPTISPEPEPTYYYGKASWYGKELCGGNPCRTASGEWFDENDFTCACSDDFPLGTRLIVSYEENSVEVRCNDRGIFKKKYGRILDLSKASFMALSPLEAGIIWVRIRKI